MIATARPIDDTIARKLSVAFYQALTKGGDEIAGAETSVVLSSRPKASSPPGMGDERENSSWRTQLTEDVTDNLGLPWDLFIRPGAQEVERWSLFTSDPLFGLPELPPELHPPVRPFRGLQPFSRAEAAVFFGAQAVLCASCSTCRQNTRCRRR